ncbi:uncharacterized protein LOC134537474 isoform X2 [Bacillus rossius redtenbacheri]
MSEDGIFHGPEPLPLANMSLGRFLMQRLQQHGDREYQIHAVTGERTTFADVLQRSTALATELRVRGVRPGQVVGVASENRLEFCLPVLAASYLGATCATFNPTYTLREMEHALNISKPCVVFCSPVCERSVCELARRLPFVREVVVFGPSSALGRPLLSDLVRPGADRLGAAEDVGPDEHVACVLCSSGTTGLPKGVMLTARNILATMTNLSDPRFAIINHNETHLGVLPFFHAYAFMCLLASLCNGFRVVVLPKFEEELFLRSIQQYKVTLLTLVPTLLVFLGKSPRVSHYDLSSLRMVWCGAAPLREEVQRQVVRRLGIAGVQQGYGLTETTLAVSHTPVGHDKPGAAGKLAPGISAKVLDLKTGQPLGVDQEGELCFKGALIMKGYLGDTGATAATLDPDGFLHTGDVGRIDRDGYVYVVDRLKELIKYKGFQVPPAELEALLLTHPAVQDAAVVGVPDSESGELPLAFVVRQPGASVSDQDLIAFIAGQVSPQKRLHGGVKFVDAIPKNASGKILRQQLRSILKSKL